MLALNYRLNFFVKYVRKLTNINGRYIMGTESTARNGHQRTKSDGSNVVITMASNALLRLQEAGVANPGLAHNLANAQLKHSPLTAHRGSAASDIGSPSARMKHAASVDQLNIATSSSSKEINFGFDNQIDLIDLLDPTSLHKSASSLNAQTAAAESMANMMVATKAPVATAPTEKAISTNVKAAQEPIAKAVKLSGFTKAKDVLLAHNIIVSLNGEEDINLKDDVAIALLDLGITGYAATNPVVSMISTHVYTSYKGLKKAISEPALKAQIKYYLEQYAVNTLNVESSNAQSSHTYHDKLVEAAEKILTSNKNLTSILSTAEILAQNIEGDLHVTRGVTYDFARIIKDALYNKGIEGIKAKISAATTPIVEEHTTTADTNTASASSAASDTADTHSIKSGPFDNNEELDNNSVVLVAESSTQLVEDDDDNLDALIARLAAKKNLSSSALLDNQNEIHVVGDTHDAAE